MGFRLKRFGVWLSVFALLSAGLLINGCNDDDDPAPSPQVSQTYNGPGSKWDVDLYDNNTFVIERRPTVTGSVSLTVEGTYERLSSGFLKLTVSSASGEDAPSANDMAWALEVPGYALLLKPVDGDQIIPMVTAGTCPTADLNANWVVVKKADSSRADDADRDFFGEFVFTIADQSARLPSRRALANSFQDGGEQSLGTGTCANGILTISDGVMYLTNNGGAIVHTSVDDPSDASFIFGLNQKAITAVSNLDGNYAGILFDENQVGDTAISPVSLSCTSGACMGTLVTNIDTGAVSNETVTVNLSGTPDQLATGLITGTIVNTTSGSLACMADIGVLGTSTKMISCVGQSPGDNQKMFNVLFVSKSS